jgi:2-methylisocitrate lyase-like PEP mutase family enzyme
MLTARAEGFLVGQPELRDVIKRLEAFAAAGADALFAPGLSRKDDVAAVVKAVAPKPVNLIVVKPWITLAEAAELGVRRISVGGALARAAWSGFAKAAHEIAEHGTFGGFAANDPPLKLNDIFGSR